MTQQSWEVWLFAGILLAVGVLLYLVSRRFSTERPGTDAAE